MDNEKKPSFLSYRVSDIKRRGTRYSEFKPGDYVVDDSNILGIVKFSSGWGNYIEFIDGLEVYDNPSIVDLGLKKSSIISSAVYEEYQRRFRDITKIARVMSETLSEYFPYVSLYNNGKNLFLRASSQSSLVSGFTTSKITDNVDFISIKFTPRWDFEIETLAIKKNKRLSNWSHLMLRDTFIDLDLGASEETRRSFISISDDHDYNDQLFENLLHRWKKFKIDII